MEPINPLFRLNKTPTTGRPPKTSAQQIAYQNAYQTWKTSHQTADNINTTTTINKRHPKP